MSKLKPGDEVIAVFDDSNTCKGDISKVIAIENCEDKEENIKNYCYKCCKECPGLLSLTTDNKIKCRGNTQKGYPWKLNTISNWRKRICN